MPKGKTDNSHLQEKISIREFLLPDGNFNVLDCFHGHGVLWGEIKRRTNREINVIGIDKREDSKVIYGGDNLKIVPSLDLSKFDVIDIDAYGSPFDLLKIVLDKKYRGIIHCTFIRSVIGNVSDIIFTSAGVTKKMLKKCKTLFNKKYLYFFEQFLAKYGVTCYYYIQPEERKLYFSIDTRRIDYDDLRTEGKGA